MKSNARLIEAQNKKIKELEEHAYLIHIENMLLKKINNLYRQESGLLKKRRIKG